MTKLKDKQQQAESEIDSFLNQLSEIDISSLSQIEKDELTSIVRDFKGDISNLKNAEHLSAQLKESLETGVVNDFKSEIKHSVDKSKELKLEASKLNKETKIGRQYALKPD